MDDECEIIAEIVTDSTRKRKYPGIKAEKDKVVDEALNKLRVELMRSSNYWLRKSFLITAETDGKIPLVKLKLLELEIGIHFRCVKEIVSSVQYLHKYCGNDEDFRARVEELIALTDGENRRSSFAKELLSKIDSNVFLEPLLASARTPINKLQALITLAKTIGMPKVAKKIYDLYTKVRIEKSSGKNGQIFGYDLIWFHLNTLLCEEQLCGLESDNVLIIYQAMLRCCVADTHAELTSEFFEISDLLGFSRINPRDHWRSCLRVLIEILYSRNSTNPTPLIQNLKRQFNELSFLQISQKLTDTFDAKADEEVSRFLLTFAISMKEFYEGNNYVVFMPGRIFDISKRNITNYWVTNTQIRNEVTEDELEFKSISTENVEQYLEVLGVARNVYQAYQKLNAGSDQDIEYNLRLLLQNLNLPNSFSLISQSMLVTGKFLESAKFIQLGIRITKNKDEQTVLMLQLLETYVAMRDTKKALTYAMELLNENQRVKDVVESSMGLLRNQRFEDDCFIQIPKDCIYHYAVLLLLNATVVSLAKKFATNTDLRNLAATIIILCVQCCWSFCVDMLGPVFELLDEEISLLNVIKIISIRVLFTKIIDSDVKFMEGSEVLNTKLAIEKFRSGNLNKKTPRFNTFHDLVIFLTSHMSIVQILFA